MKNNRTIYGEDLEDLVQSRHISCHLVRLDFQLNLMTFVWGLFTLTLTQNKYVSEQRCKYLREIVLENEIFCPYYAWIFGINRMYLEGYFFYIDLFLKVISALLVIILFFLYSRRKRKSIFPLEADKTETTEECLAWKKLWLQNLYQSI